MLKSTLQNKISMLSAVIDLNVLFSGLLFGGNAAKVVDMWIEGKFDLVASTTLLDQLELVLSRPKFSKYWPSDHGKRILIAFRAGALIQESTLDLRLCRDPDDDALLNLAAGAASGFLVTGDHDLLDDDELKCTMLDQHGVRVVNPNEFLVVLEAQQ